MVDEVRPRVPSSLASTRYVAPAAIVAATLVTLLELFAVGGGDPWLVALALFVPAMTAAIVSVRLAQGRVRQAMGGATLGACATFAVFLNVGVVMNERSELIGKAFLATACSYLLVCGVALPVSIAATVLGARRDLEAGDALLGICGAWLAGFQAFKMATTSSSDALLFVPGLLLGLLAIAIYARRRVARRRWCERVARGELTGWRVRPTTSPAELAALPPVFGSPDAVSAVIEMVESEGMIYRGGLVLQPVAAVRFTP